MAFNWDRLCGDLEAGEKAQNKDAHDGSLLLKNNLKIGKRGQPMVIPLPLCREAANCEFLAPKIFRNPTPIFWRFKVNLRRGVTTKSARQRFVDSGVRRLLQLPKLCRWIWKLVRAMVCTS